ncbi:G5 domain-containing protein [Aedoeadaptatus pacaensis]|uniref:G5 domain-containing protein n=1 Tax=Aedoeadaptatus pacaensis TaxID=1776390 RepID=UPI000838A345|nr:G5 domain-containing protein [Peptoniphilus pacaensis]
MTSNKEIRDVENFSAIPLSNESIKKRRNNLLKSVIGASVIATGLTMMPQASFAQVAEQPPAIVQKEAVAAQAPAANATEAASSEAPAKAKKDEAAEALAVDSASVSDAAPEAQGTEAQETAAPAETATTPEAGLEIGKEQSPEAQQGAETEPNYVEDEKKIQDYNESEHYKETDLQPGNVNQELYNTDEKKVKDGFKFDVKNPSAESPSKTEYGYQITIDKKTGQRTYTKISVTDSGLVPAPLGEKPMMEEGDKLTSESPEVNFKPDENGEVTAGGRQRNLNYEAGEETLKHINSKDNSSTSFGMKDDYTKENPGVKFFGENFVLTYKVNPWPNENDKLELMKLNGEYNEKVFVQGQDIDTGIKVDNVDENAKERLVGQVYNPVTGKIVPGASAYIGDDGNIHVKLPDGALKKDESGKTVINEDSIFNTPEFKALQNLDVKFFARPRTADEFRKIAQTPDDFGEIGTYTETGAGTGTINHKGQDVTIDKQGIDRYDHYNLIGDFKLNLDDTRYYEQNFIDGNNEDTRKNTSSSVKPGEPFEVKIYEPEESGKYQKSSSEMNEAENRGEASGKVILDFINRENQGKEDKDQWKVTLTDGDIGKFSITPPKSAKAGDFVAVPVEYTYTNGSKDTHWFHFVVQESDNYRPEYHAEIGFKGDKLTSTPDPVPEDTKKNKPLSYELVPGTYKDSAGHVWDNIKVDPKTGVVTAVVPEHAEIKGGENLFVDVKVNYEDEYGVKKEETVKAQFIARPKYKQEVTKEFTSKIPFETKVVYDDTLEAGKVVKTEGVVGETKTTFKQVVINGEKGIINDKGEFVAGKESAEVTTVTEKQDAVIRIGTKPAETKVEIPFDTEYELDYTKKKGEAPTEITPGKKGEVTITTTRDPETGEIKVTQEETKAPEKRKLSIPAGTEGTHEYKEEKPFTFDVEFDPNFYTNYPDATENYKVVTEGKVGEKTTKWKIENSKIVGEPEITETDPINAIIKVGQKDYTGTVNNTVTKEVPYTVKVEYNPNLAAGTTNVKQEGKAGSRTYEYSGDIVNGKLKDGTNFTEKELTDKYVEPTEHIIEIGTKPVENTKDVESEVGVDVEWVFDPNKDIGVIEVGDLIPGKVTTTTKNVYDPATGEIKTIQETVVEKGKRKVVAGTKAYNGEFEEVNKDIIPYETEIVFDNTLKAGEKEITQAGENGLKTTTTKRHIVNGEVVGSDDPVEEITKEAKKQIIRVGTMTDGTHSHTEKLPFETHVEVNPELKKGEWRYKTVDGAEQKGKLGSRKTEWTIVNSEVQKDPKVTEEKPVDAIIEVGSADFEGEVKHTEHFEIPFEVEVRYNDQLPAGTSKEIQKGVVGSYDVEYKQAIKNGEADGEMTKTESNKVEAKKHIIEIGTKVETPENNYSKDVEVEIEYVYDDTKDKGVVETGVLTPGKVETKVVDKFNPETGKVEQKTEQVVTKAKQKVIVGAKDFTGTYEYKKTCPIPFEVEVREDPTLSKGEKKIEQQGVAGSKTTSYEQAIKNGQPDGQARQVGEPTIVEPTKHIVLVGTKSLEGNREYVVDKAIPYGTKVTYDENLEAGTRIVDNEGKDGTERVTTTIATKDGTIEYNSHGTVIVEKEDRVVRVGIKPVVKTEEIPFEKEFEHDPNLEAGKTEKISDGTPGKVTITTSFNKETGKLETKVVRTEPTNAKYKYGSKTEGSFTVESEIPFKVQVIEDETLDAGTYKVEQEGVVGKKETAVKVKNSKEESREVKTITEAVDKIIRVGTKPNDKMCPVPEDPSTPNNPNPSNPGGDNPVNPNPSNPGNPGGDNPSTPGGNTPGGNTPGGDNPVNPNPNTPNNPANPNPSTPGSPANPDKSEGSVPGRASQVDEEDGSRRATPSALEGAKGSDDAKAPQTFDPGVAAPAGLAALASGLLVGLERLKRRKRD